MQRVHGELYNRPISYENTHFSFVVASREKVSLRWGIKKKNHSHKIFWGGGGGSFRPPLDRTLTYVCPVAMVSSCGWGGGGGEEYRSIKGHDLAKT